MILDLLEKSENVLLATHTKPDGDALGSLIALGLSLIAKKKRVTLYNESATPAVYRFLRKVDLVTDRIGPIERYDTAVILDCSDLGRVGSQATAIGGIPTVINIDHHVTNNHFGDFQLIDTAASSTAEIVYGLIRELKTPVTPTIAYAIYTGILTDTGSFRFQNTTEAAFAICTEMIRAGVEPHRVASNVYGTYTLGRVRLLNMVLDSIEVSENGKLSLMAITQSMLQKTGTHPSDVTGLIDYARQIEDVKVAVLIQETFNFDVPSLHGERQYNNRFQVSLRSNGSVDVSAIATMFGGGGHASAAGFSIESRFRDLKEHILNLAETL